jgi:hypothetical protein
MWAVLLDVERVQRRHLLHLLPVRVPQHAQTQVRPESEQQQTLLVRLQLSNEACTE